MVAVLVKQYCLRKNARLDYMIQHSLKRLIFLKKNEDGYYLFQMYKYYKTTDSVRKKFIPFTFFSNQPDSIKEKWRYKD